MPCSRASRRAAGEPTGGLGFETPIIALALSRGLPMARVLAGRGVWPGGRISARSAVASTMEAAGTLICKMPRAGDSTSTTALSVSTSTMLCPRRTGIASSTSQRMPFTCSIEIDTGGTLTRILTQPLVAPHPQPCRHPDTHSTTTVRRELVRPGRRPARPGRPGSRSHAPCTTPRSRPLPPSARSG